MTDLFAEPRPVRAVGDLFTNIWQVAYVTRDLDRGMATMRDEFGVANCTEVPTDGATFLRGDEPVEWDARFAMGARGGLVIELIEPVGGEVDFYRRLLPEDGSPAPRFHHLATFMPTGDEEWSSLIDVLAASGLKVDYTVLIPNRVRAGYIDTTAELGHFLEVCQVQEADIEFFRGLVEQSA
jgi:Glyoxalase/Bleomycin resistance protein/Dioxygenase superfamily